MKHKTSTSFAVAHTEKSEAVIDIFEAHGFGRQVPTEKGMGVGEKSESIGGRPK